MPVRRVLRWSRRLAYLWFALLALASYVVVTAVQVVLASREDDRRPSAAIIVSGAAQWNGKPSPVLQQRLDHAVDLYKAGVAPMVIVTGGKQSGDKVTQGVAGFQYLRGKGVPEKAIKVEVDGTNTYEELSASALIVRNAGGGANASVTIVSDGYHMLRVRDIGGELGLDARGSPSSSDLSPASVAREALAVAGGRIVQFRRLSAWA